MVECMVELIECVFFSAGCSPFQPTTCPSLRKVAFRWDDCAAAPPTDGKQPERGECLACLQDSAGTVDRRAHAPRSADLNIFKYTQIKIKYINLYLVLKR
jgi:hypothetical protein